MNSFLSSTMIVSKIVKLAIKKLEQCITFGQSCKKDTKIGINNVSSVFVLLSLNKFDICSEGFTLTLI